MNEDMRIFKSNHTIEYNVKYGVYYNRTDKDKNFTARYIGLYNDVGGCGAVKYIGEIDKIVDAKIVSRDDFPVLSCNSVLSVSQKDRIRMMIQSAPAHHFIKNEEVTFFLVDKFYETNFLYTGIGSYPGSGGSGGKITFEKYLGSVENSKLFTAEQIAEKLIGMEWGPNTRKPFRIELD